MSEAELHILKQRMLEGKRAKARRGALGMRVPMGYVHHRLGLLVGVFERTRTLHGLLRYLEIGRASCRERV